MSERPLTHGEILALKDAWENSPNRLEALAFRVCVAYETMAKLNDTSRKINGGWAEDLLKVMGENDALRDAISAFLEPGNPRRGANGPLRDVLAATAPPSTTSAAKLATVMEAAEPLVEWLEAAVPGCQRLCAPTAIVGPSQVNGRDVGLTVEQATKLLAALKAVRS